MVFLKVTENQFLNPYSSAFFFLAVKNLNDPKNN